MCDEALREVLFGDFIVLRIGDMTTVALRVEKQHHHGGSFREAAGQRIVHEAVKQDGGSFHCIAQEHKACPDIVLEAM